jgi:choline monooxygenase
VTDYDFDPRLERASTLPASWYTDPLFLQRELTQVFGQTWQLVGHERSVHEPGSYFTTTIGHEPVVVVRGGDGELRAMSNVCRHRAGPVAQGSGRRPALQCGYHGWTWSLDGRLLQAPEMEGIERFDRSSICLPRFEIDRWNGLLFVRIQPQGPPLREVLGELASRFDGRGYESYRLAARKEWEVACNWKVYVDNYLEGYHIAIVHPGLFGEIDYARYRTETHRYHSMQHAPLRRVERVCADGDSQAADYFWVFPNLMINAYPDNFSTNLIVPLGHGRTLTVFEWYFRDPDATGARVRIADTVSFSDEIQIEDVAICEEVQKGLQSATYASGRYSPLRESGVHHFHGLLAEYLGARTR